jgi:hypothetical protein
LPVKIFETRLSLSTMGELLIRVDKRPADHPDPDNVFSYLGTIYSRTSVGKPFTEIMYFVEEELSNMKEEMTRVLKNLFAGEFFSEDIFAELVET